MGRPNVGKSSLLNALLGDERSLVADEPGTTRDPVDTELLFDGLPVVLVDTAGIRRRSAARDRLEHFSMLRGIKAMERADAVLLVMDASEGVLTQDQHVAGYALEAGKGLILVVNKVDLLEAESIRNKTWESQIRSEFKFVPHAPVVPLSAKTGEGTASAPTSRIGGGWPAPDSDPDQRAESVPEGSVPAPAAAQLQGSAPAVAVRDPGLFGGAHDRPLRQRCRPAPLLLPALPRKPASRAVRFCGQSAEAGTAAGFGRSPLQPRSGAPITKCPSLDAGDVYILTTTSGPSAHTMGVR